jgi:hypothetical protein
MLMIIYVAGKYSGDTDANIDAARLVAIDVWKSGNVAICPHLNTVHFEQVPDLDLTWEDYLQGDFNIISRCDAMIMVPGWEDSRGAVAERVYAQSLAMPIYYYPDVPPVHPTEVKAPDQCKGFREILGKMYRVHLDKNADYSSNNILMTGMTGLTTRVWDKVARLLNLTGFKLRVFTRSEIANSQPLSRFLWMRWYERLLHWIFRDEKFARFDGYVEDQRKPKNESIEDSLYDLSVYGIIGLLLRYGLWGH